MIALLIKIFLAGLAVLAAAIAMNAAAGALGLQTWYSFLSQVSAKGWMSALQALRWLDFLFLGLVYPSLLGLSAYLVLSLGGK